MSGRKEINKDFFKQWSPEMAYVLGFFAADGYITVNNRGGQYWCIQITDRELLEGIRKAVGSDHALGVRSPRKQSESELYRLQVGSVEMCNDLRRLGFNERKTANMTVPHVPDRCFPSFVKGYFDGDGNVWVGYVHKERKNKLLAIQTVFTSCSDDFLKALKSRLEKFNIGNGVIRRNKNGNYHRLTYSIRGSMKLYEFMYNHKVKMSDSLGLVRKKRVFDDYLTMRP